MEGWSSWGQKGIQRGVKKERKKMERCKRPLQFYPSGNTKKPLWLVTLQKREEKQGGCMNLWIRLLFGGGLWKYLAIICAHMNKNSQVSYFDGAKKLRLIRISRWAFIYRVDETVQWVQPRAQKYWLYTGGQLLFQIWPYVQSKWF